MDFLVISCSAHLKALKFWHPLFEDSVIPVSAGFQKFLHTVKITGDIGGSVCIRADGDDLAAQFFVAFDNICAGVDVAHVF